MLFALERMGYLIGPVQNSFTDSEQCFLQRFDSLSCTDIMPARWSDYDGHVTGYNRNCNRQNFICSCKLFSAGRMSGAACSEFATLFAFHRTS